MTEIEHESDFEEESSPEMKELETLMKPFRMPQEDHGSFWILESTRNATKGKPLGVGFSWFYGNHGDDKIFFTNEPFRLFKEYQLDFAIRMREYNHIECKHDHMVLLEQLPKKQRKEIYDNCLCGANPKEVGKVLSRYLKYPEDEPGDWYTIVHIEIKLAKNEYNLEVERIFYAHRCHGEDCIPVIILPKKKKNRDSDNKNDNETEVIDITDSVADGDVIDLTDE